MRSVDTARDYLTRPGVRRTAIDARVINLCRTDRYQGRGYYVSLLAEARGHRPLPDVKTVEDLQSRGACRAARQRRSTQLVQETLQHDETERFELDAYFGSDPGQRTRPRAAAVRHCAGAAAARAVRPRRTDAGAYEVACDRRCATFRRSTARC